MTNKSFSKRSLLIFILSLLCVFCTCAFFVACSANNDSEEDSKTYTYTEEDTEIISNASFAYGTTEKSADEFPIASPTGWSKSTDNSAASSGVNSGVVNLDKWDSVYKKLTDDTDFTKAYKKKFGTEPAENAAEETNFANPAKSPDSTDSCVFMLNNYSSTYLGSGTAQRIKSSSTVSVKKGETYEISVWVKTIIFSSFDGDGACIRISPSINGNSQAEFQINNINTKDVTENNGWAKFTVYFVADDDYDCSFYVMLGLGYGNGTNTQMADYVEGTVFFDEISVTESTSDIAATPLVFGSSEPVTVDANGATNTTFKFSMQLNTNAYFKAADKVAVNATAASGDYTKSLSTDKDDNPITSKTKTGNGDVTGYSYDSEKKEGTLILNNQASYTLTIKNKTGDYFEITTLDEEDYEKYALLSFKIKNELNKLGSTDITVNVVDFYHDDEFDKNYTETRKAVATFSDVSDEFVICNIVVNNNFKKQTRKFYLEIVIGPTDPATVTALSEFASGKVTITDINVAYGYISSEKYKNKAKDAEYKFYSFYSSNASAKTALYAGSESDFSEHNHSASYSLTPASGTIGQITAHPTAVNGYNGITADHAYVSDSKNYDINTRAKFDGDNSYAGLINTKYIATYKTKDAGLEDALNGLYDAENDIQPIVIYNKTADSYGFIGAQKTVSASDYAKVTVKLKVVGNNAKAYIYLVDTSNEKKEILTFADFTANTSAGIKNSNVNQNAERKFMLKVDKDAPAGNDGFVEVNFYLATGADAENFRVEVWNGARDGENKSTGYVIINSIDVTTSSAFTEPTTWQSAFDDESSPFYNKMDDFDAASSELIAYTRELTETEIKFNKEYPDKAVSYKSTYVWANSDTMVYGVLNTINPVESDPYASIETEEETSGCAAESDPSTFWMSFSSIVLAATLVLAIIALIVKRAYAKHKANKTDVKAQYKVKSRTESQKEINKAKERKAEKITETAEEPKTVIPEDSTDETNAIEENDISDDANATNGDDTEQTGYVYGEVQDFGDMTLEMPEENADKDKKDE